MLQFERVTFHNPWQVSYPPLSADFGRWESQQQRSTPFTNISAQITKYVSVVSLLICHVHPKFASKPLLLSSDMLGYFTSLFRANRLLLTQSVNITDISGGTVATLCTQMQWKETPANTDCCVTALFCLCRAVQIASTNTAESSTYTSMRQWQRVNNRPHNTVTGVMTGVVTHSRRLPGGKPHHRTHSLRIHNPGNSSTWQLIPTWERSRSNMWLRRGFSSSTTLIQTNNTSVRYRQLLT